MSSPATAAAPGWSVVAVPPPAPVRATVVLLHGLGADGHDLAPIAPALDRAGGTGIRFLFPEAPVRPVTINGGMVMRAWYDIRAIHREDAVDQNHLAEAVAGARALCRVERERGTPRSRIVLAGFSQGGAVALAAAVEATASGGAPPFGAVAALSAYLPLPGGRRIEPHAPSAADLPIFMGHGEYDDMVPIAAGQRSRARLAEAGFEVEFHRYPIGHQLSEPELRDLGGFLRRVLARTPPA